jgi:sugar (pentulose or hexulose) kinase
MKNQCVLGLDAGTTAFKGILVGEDGRILGEASREYSLEFHGRDIVEIDPEIYWQSTVGIIRQLLSVSAVPPGNIRALAFSSQGESMVCVDDRGNPLRKAIVWMDNRSAREAEDMKKDWPARAIREKTGQTEILPLWPATRVRWLREREPAVFSRIHKFLLVADYLVFRLTGLYASEPSLLSSTLYYDIVHKRYWEEMLDYLGIRPGQLPEVHHSGTALGKISPGAAAATGLSPDTLMVAGAYDHPAGAIGSGNIRAGIISETTGTAMAMVVTLDEPMLEGDLPCQCHALPGKYFLLPYGQTAGMVLKWFRDAFCREEIELAGSTGRDPYQIMDALAGDTGPGAEGLVMLPHLMGAGSPEFDMHVKGVFAGISPGLGKGHFIRAIMESVAFMIRRNIDSLRDSGITVGEIRALGGGARSRLWNQIKADVTGVPYMTLESGESACLGAAILAGTGSGTWSSTGEACAGLVKVMDRFAPDPGKKALYDPVYARYVSLYDHLRTYW